MIRRNILSDQSVASQFIDAVNGLKDPQESPWPGQDGLSIYDFFVFWHHRAMMLPTPPSQSDRNAAHSGPVFLPWHRYMLLRLESFLQDVLGDNGFRLPYWNSAADASLNDPTTSAIWSQELLGQFTSSNWRVRIEPAPSGVNPRITDRLLDRSLGGTLPTLQQVREAVADQVIYDSPPFDRSAGGFRNMLEGWTGPGRLHNAVHVWVGGDMQTSTSPNDPAFYLHHCNVDRIWAAWQVRHSTATYIPQQNASEDLLFHRMDDPMHTFFDEEVTPAQMLDVSTSYEYDTFEDILPVSPVPFA